MHIESERDVKVNQVNQVIGVRLWGPQKREKETLNY